MVSIPIRVSGDGSERVNEVIQWMDRLVSQGSFVNETLPTCNFVEEGTFGESMRSDLFTFVNMKWNTGEKTKSEEVNYTYWIQYLIEESVHAGAVDRLHAFPEMSDCDEDEFPLRDQIYDAMMSPDLAPILQHFAGPDGEPYNIASEIVPIILGAIYGRLCDSEASETLDALLGLVCQGLCPFMVEGDWPGDYKIYACRFFPSPDYTIESFQSYLENEYEPPSIEERLAQLSPEVWEDMEELSMIESDLLPAAVARLNSEQLHEYVEIYNWDDGADLLNVILGHEECDRATVLLTYWASSPDAWAGKEENEIADYNKPVFSVFKQCEALLQADNFKNRSIEFLGRESIGGVDSYWEGIEANPHIPQEYYRVS